MKKCSFRKIHIIGGPGSGKTFLANILSNKLGIKCYDLDEFFWDNTKDTFGVRADTELRDRKLAETVTADSWLIEGVYYGWVNESFKNADLILVLVPGTFIRDLRIVKRFVYRRVGILKCKKKETFKGLYDLLKWNHAYDKKNLKEIMNLTEGFTNKRIILRNRKEEDTFLKRLCLK